MTFTVLYIILYTSLYFVICQWAHGPAPHSVCAYVTPLLLMAHDVAMDMDMTSTVLHIILYASLYFVICLLATGPVLIPRTFDGPECSHGHGYDVRDTVYHFVCVIIFRDMSMGPWSCPTFRVCVHYTTSFDGPQCSHGHGYDVHGTAYHFACVIVFRNMPMGPWSCPDFPCVRTLHNFF